MLAIRIDAGHEKPSILKIYIPVSCGIRNVSIPKTILLLLLRLKSTIFISSPAMNIMYSNPIEPSNSMADDIEIILNPFGPNATPERITPTTPGNLIKREMMGAIKIINIKTRNNKTLSVIGKLIDVFISMFF
jgi:hypothetical protein